MTKFTPKIPDEEVNFTKESPLKDFLLLLCGVVGLLLILGYSANFALQRYLPSLSFKQEVDFFNSKNPLSKTFKTDEKLNEFVMKLWQPFDEEGHVTFVPEIQESKEVNAFMGVGGQMTVTKGLLTELKTLNGLSFVLCHELGHFYHRHVIKKLGRKMTFSTLSYLFGLGSADGIINFVSNSFSRKEEAEADHFAVTCVQKQFGHVDGIDEFFSLIISKENLLERVPFLHTHPISKERLESIELLSIQLGYSLTGNLINSPF